MGIKLVNGIYFTRMLEWKKNGCIDFYYFNLLRGGGYYEITKGDDSVFFQIKNGRWIELSDRFDRYWIQYWIKSFN